MTEQPTPAESGPLDATEDAAVAATRRHILLVFAGLMVTMLLASLDQMIFSTALPTIVGELDGVNHMLWASPPMTEPTMKMAMAMMKSPLRPMRSPSFP